MTQRPRERVLLDADQQSAVIEGLAAGRAEAWAALYDEYAEIVWRYAARLLGAGRDGVADVVQETFLAAARSARTFDATRGTLGSWLLGIVHQQTTQYWRRRSRETRSEERGVRTEQLNHNSADELQRCERAEHVRRVLAEMPAEYAWLLVQKYVDDRPIAALTGDLAAGAEAVKSKLARARRLFRTAMSRERVGAGPRSVSHE
jgi:RNA polymerase sigma-70 factor (ECF subfamily)